MNLPLPGSEGTFTEFGIDMYTLLYLKEITKKENYIYIFHKGLVSKIKKNVYNNYF